MLILPAVSMCLLLLQGPADDLPAKYKPAAPPPATVVALVNGVEIKAADVEGLLWDWRAFDVIQDLISYQLVRAEAQKQRVDISEAQVDQALEAGIKQMSATLPPGKTVETALLEQGFTRSRLYLRYRTEAYISGLIDRSFNPRNLVKVSTINFKPKTEQAPDVAASIQKAQQAYDRLAKGETWDAVLASATSDPNVLKSKGLLGWRELDAFPETVRAELQAMKPGQTTKPAQTPYGIQIFRLDAAGKGAASSDVAEMKQVYAAAARKPLLDRLRAEGKVERLWPNIPGLNPQKDGN